MNQINPKTLEFVDIDTNHFSPLSYLSHKISKEGSYTMQVYSGSKLVLKATIKASPKKEKQKHTLNFDLASIEEYQSRTFYINSEEGYLLFYNSKFSDKYHVVIKSKKNVEFDSSKLSVGDAFHLNILRPGVYALKTKESKASLKLNVQYPKIDLKNLTPEIKEAVKIGYQDFSKSKTINLLPNQGVTIYFDNKLKSASAKLIQINKPIKGSTLREQLKSYTKRALKKRKSTSKRKQKHQWTSKSGFIKVTK